MIQYSKFINQMNTISDELIRESIDLECKLAAGRDVRFRNFWPTYRERPGV